MNAAVRSGLQVRVLHGLDDEALDELLRRSEAAIGHPLPLDPDARTALKALADGDGRYLLNLVEELARLRSGPLDTAALAAAVQRRAPLYDKSQEGHYNLISALHRSLREIGRAHV